jgi:hypothetical protein
MGARRYEQVGLIVGISVAVALAAQLFHGRSIPPITAPS